MLWVGGHILLVGVDELGWHTPYAFVHHLEELVAHATGPLGGFLGMIIEFGFDWYGTREVARRRDDADHAHRTLWNITAAKLLLCATVASGCGALLLLLRPPGEEALMLTREHKRELVEALHAEGAFKGKSAANYVANVLNMGRATVYKHLKEIKGEA